jgi:hypothetical protein
MKPLIGGSLARGNDMVSYRPWGYYSIHQPLVLEFRGIDVRKVIDSRTAVQRHRYLEV